MSDVSPDRPLLIWRGMTISLPILRIFAVFWVSLVGIVGCFWILLEPNNPTETNAAIAILTVIITGWVSNINRRVEA